ncbi:potassium-transporting ATPase subunit C [Hymenobacter siberiensis]|jgi:K+-transporting ATPase ATPase C chain|uniref:potassium-transporting ATPase subunit C n=1 Tax=Hymenobacter siberiensis TaxID=2848396 RepID=UPI001C1E5E19|nr:potassium-transporting ATPase subunit C [Hymenobacter siberiensis]MBU6123051.1 potassium-transporting ATPase subunit C [Hymenobacter siberiensis]
MKTQLNSAFRLPIALLVLCCILCPAFVAAVAQAAPGAGVQISRNSPVAGFANGGQKFDAPGYFNSRPSAADYQVDASSGSNKGSSNPACLKTVHSRLTAFAQQRPTALTGQVPAALLTTSGAGRGPHLLPAGALVQVARVARVRGLPEAQVRALVARHVEKPLLAFFGPAKVNVWQLNLALDSLAAR